MVSTKRSDTKSEEYRFDFIEKFKQKLKNTPKMYAFYADESGSPRALKYEANQPILVVAGILIEFSKLEKALSVFDEILLNVNTKLKTPVNELKFSEIRNKEPFRSSLPKVEERADLLESILTTFQKEIDFKIVYCAVDNEKFYEIKRQEPVLRNNLKHPYLAAAYKVLGQLEVIQSKKKKGKTFVIFDEQDIFQNNLEDLIEQPLHKKQFDQIFDTAYFGKSQHSKIIQIADLLAGTIRYYFGRLKGGKNEETDHWTDRISTILENMSPNLVQVDCFSGELKDLFAQFELDLNK